jgi:hypothetical protein
VKQKLVATLHPYHNIIIVYRIFVYKSRSILIWYNWNVHFMQLLITKHLRILCRMFNHLFSFVQATWVTLGLSKCLRTSTLCRISVPFDSIHMKVWYINSSIATVFWGFSGLVPDPVRVSYLHWHCVLGWGPSVHSCMRCGSPACICLPWLAA